MNAKRTITLIIIAILALFIAACGSAQETDAPPGPAAPFAPPGGTPPPGGQGQGPGFGGGPQDGGPMGIMTVIMDATGLDPETLQAEAAEGATLAEIITAHGGDVEAVKADLIESMSQMPDADEETIEQRVDDLLNNPLPLRGPGGAPGGDQGGQ